jgi:hypothetical protein
MLIIVLRLRWGRWRIEIRLSIRREPIQPAPEGAPQGVPPGSPVDIANRSVRFNTSAFLPSYVCAPACRRSGADSQTPVTLHG